jgi:hypothetical protein
VVVGCVGAFVLVLVVGGGVGVGCCVCLFGWWGVVCFWFLVGGFLLGWLVFLWFLLVWGCGVFLVCLGCWWFLGFGLGWGGVVVLVVCVWLGVVVCGFGFVLGVWGFF